MPTRKRSLLRFHFHGGLAPPTERGALLAYSRDESCFQFDNSECYISVKKRRTQQPCPVEDDASSSTTTTELSTVKQTEKDEAVRSQTLPSSCVEDESSKILASLSIKDKIPTPAVGSLVGNKGSSQRLWALGAQRVRN